MTKEGRKNYNRDKIKKLNIDNSTWVTEIPDFSNLKNLNILRLANCSLWSEDIESLKVLKDNTNLTIDLEIR